jgi:hypothetical protein
MSRNNWRYKTLKSGEVYIASAALQDIVVSSGLKASLPWVQNMANPRLKVSHADGRLIAEINRTLLVRAGVETNPGPAIPALLVFAVTFAGFSFTEQLLEGVTMSLPVLTQSVTWSFEWMFGEWLDNWTMDCAYDQADREWLRVVYSLPGIGRMFGLFARFGLVYSYGEARRAPLVCSILLKFRQPLFTPLYDLNVIWWYCVAMSCLSFVAFTSSCIITVLVSRRWFRRVRVHNKQKFFAVNELKDQFRRYKDKLTVPDHQPGQHIRLAFQRKAAEAFCFDMLLDKFDRVRDVGGSRSRFPELGFAKHVCGPVLSNDDILREDKSRGVFEVCKTRGEECPYRLSIPAWILSHVDYHLTPAQMALIATGPGFIITHNFNRHHNGVGAYEGKKGTQYEATVQVSNGSVTMIPEGGTPYLAHPFHNWLSEGSVVAQTGAFTYVELGEIGETSVIYCHPSDGVYSLDSPTALTTNAKDCYPMIGSYAVLRNDNTNMYELTSAARNRCVTLPTGLIDEVAMTMSSAPRDVKYANTMRSYLTGKLRALGLGTDKLEIAYHLSCYLSDRMAVDVVPFSTCIRGNPVDFGWRVWMVNKMRILVHATLGNGVWRAVWLGTVVESVIPWMFPTVHVPTYEVYTNQISAKFGGGLRTKFNNNCFRTPAPANLSSTTQCSQPGPSQNVGQCFNSIGDSSSECGSETASESDVEVGAPSGRKSSVHQANVQQGGAQRGRIVNGILERRAPKAREIPEDVRSPTSVRENARSRPAERKTVVGIQQSPAEPTPVVHEYVHDFGSTGPTVSSEPEPVAPSATIDRLPIVVPKILVDEIEPEGDRPRLQISGFGKPYVSTLPRFVTDFVNEELDGCPTELYLWVESVLAELGQCERDKVIDLVQYLIGLAAQPAGKFSDKSSIPAGSGLLPILTPEQSQNLDTVRYKSFTFRGMGIAVPRNAAQAAEGSQESSGQIMGESKGRDRKKFSKNRNQRKKWRSQKYQS